MNNHFAFLPMEASNDIMGSPSALRERLNRDGYLYLRAVLDPERIAHVRRQVLRVLAKHGWIDRQFRPGAGVCKVTPIREMEEEFLTVYDDVQRLEAFHSLAHDDGLLKVMRDLLGESAFPHPLKIARLSFPDHYEASTPPHQDYPNNQGTERLTAAWVPLSDVPAELGGLAVLRGSHRYGTFPLVGHPGPGNRAADVPREVQEACRWVTTEFEAGDVLLFRAHTLHASLHNASEFLMRLSVDFRYQCEGEALTPICLEPHYARLSWDQIYEGWESTELQYYWRDLDYRVEPFQAMEVDDQHLEFTKEEVASMLKYVSRRDARVRRRLDALSELVGGSADG